jgi:serine/threonine protein kinase
MQIPHIPGISQIFNARVNPHPTEKTTLSKCDDDKECKGLETETESIELINEGAFGCIFHPGIRCDGKIEDRRYITKIEKVTRNSKNELRISDKIRHNIRGYANFFAPIISQCPVEITQKYVSKLNECGVFRRAQEEGGANKYVSNKILYLGKETLYTYLSKIAAGEIETNESVSQPVDISLWNAILNTHIRIVTGVQHLLDANIIHMDLKYGNIMVDSITWNPIIIDFGISVDYDTLVKSPETAAESAFYIYDTYTAWCFEVFLCNYVVNVIGLDHADSVYPTEDEMESIMTAFKYGAESKHARHSKIRNDIFSSGLVSQTTVSEFRKKMISQFVSEETRAKSWKQIYEYCVTKTYTTWDNYSVAAMYLGILDIIHTKNSSVFSILKNTHSEEINIWNTYKNLIESIVYSVPEERPDIKNTISQLSEIHKHLASSGQNKRSKRSKRNKHNK